MLHFKLFSKLKSHGDSRRACRVFNIQSRRRHSEDNQSCSANSDSAAPLRKTAPRRQVWLCFFLFFVFVQRPLCDATTAATECTPLTLAWASAMKKSSVRALCRGSSTVTLVGSWFRPFSIVMKSCHSGRSSVSSQALGGKDSNGEMRSVHTHREGRGQEWARGQSPLNRACSA